jgi:hypothetical protein
VDCVTSGTTNILIAHTVECVTSGAGSILIPHTVDCVTSGTTNILIAHTVDCVTSGANSILFLSLRAVNRTCHICATRSTPNSNAIPTASHTHTNKIRIFCRMSDTPGPTFCLTPRISGTTDGFQLVMTSERLNWLFASHFVTSCSSKCCLCVTLVFRRQPTAV